MTREKPLLLFTLALLAGSTIPAFADTTTITNYSAQGTVGTPGTIFPSISLHAAFDTQYQAGLTWYAQWSNPAHNGYIALNPSSFTVIDLGQTDNTAIMQGTVSSVSQTVSGDVLSVVAGDTVKITLDKTGYPFTSTWRVDDLTRGTSTSGTMSSETINYHTTVSDTTPPTVSITSPVNGATISGASVAINVAASDNVGVTKVEIYIDGSLGATDTTAPYAFTLDSTKMTNGAHTIMTKAYDAANNIGTASISVTVSNAAQNKVVDVGAQSTDASALPNVGARSVIDVLNQPSVPSGSSLLSWVADEASNGIWMQIGYQNTPTLSASPQGFLQVWNLNTFSLLQNKNFAVTTGPHTFSIYLKSGTLWGMSYDGTEVSTYDTGVSVSSSTYPVESVIEMQSPSTFSFNTVDFSTAMQVQKTVGGTWNNVVTATAYGNAFGVQGHNQNSALATNAINIGTSLTVTPSGVTLWTIQAADTSPPTVSITTPSNGATISGTSTVSITASDNVGVTKVELYIDNILQATATTSPYAFSVDTTKLSNAAHTFSTKAYDAANNIGTASISVTVSNAVPNVLYYAGATSIDASAIPNYGVRSTINVINQNNMPTGSDVLPWVAETLSNNIWIQAGYFNQPNGSGSTDPPQGFEEIWNLNTNTVLETKYFPVTLGNHVFAISLSSGTTWVVTYDGTTITSYNTGTSVSSASLPVEAKVEIQASSLIPIATVTFPTAFQVQKQPGGSWTNVVTATQGSNNFGTEGQIQNPSLPANDINIGTSIGITHGAVLWNIVQSDTTSPTTVITAPTNGATISSTVTVTATASDNVGVVKVEFYLNGVLKNTDTASPYSWILDTTTLTDGAYTILDKAYDAAGNVGTSQISVTVSNVVPDTTPPTATITSPTSGQTVSGTIALGASASDNVQVSKVDFYVDNVLKGTDISSPYSLSIDTTQYTNGQHNVYAKATDTSNNVGTAPTVTFTISNVIPDTTPPTTSITSPANGATVSKGITVSASASDNIGVVKVEFYIDGALRGSSTVAPYTYVWDTTTFTNGAHTIQSKAYDAANNIGTSTTVSVTVNNVPLDTTPPTVIINSPANGARVSGATIISVSASDASGIAKIQIYIDSNLVSTVLSSSASYTWTPSGKGYHTITAVAFDVPGNSASTSVTVRSLH